MADPPPPSYNQATQHYHPPHIGDTTDETTPLNAGATYPSAPPTYPPVSPTDPSSSGVAPYPSAPPPSYPADAKPEDPQGYPPRAAADYPSAPYPPAGPTPYPPAPTDSPYPPGPAPYPPSSGPYPPPSEPPNIPPPAYPPSDPAYPPSTYPHPSAPTDIPPPAYPPSDPAYPPGPYPNPGAPTDIPPPSYPPSDPAYPPACTQQPSPCAPGFFPGEPQPRNICEPGANPIIHEELRPPEFEEIPVTVVDSEGGCCQDDKDSETCCCYCRVSCSTLCHAGFAIGIIGLIYCYFFTDSPTDYIPFAITAGVCYGLLWMETWCSHDMSYLMSVKSLPKFTAYMATMHAQRPEITMDVECYHYETRYRTVYYTDSNGNRQSRTESYQEKVVTHREKEEFMFTRCNELTPANINLSGIKATRITFYDRWCFADIATKLAYKNQFEALQNRNRDRDSHMKAHENYSLPGYEKRVLAYVHPDARHPCHAPCAYMVLSFIVCTWPYRWWFKSTTGCTNYTFVKEIGL